MQERLIEYWLDNVNERSYQPAFLQMLAGEGHQIVHSTRHMPLEFGKDVISLAPDGVPCAYQLKGNPGGRLTLSQFREIKPQIDELVEQPIVYPGIPDTPHRCYLVTNGEIEEEVQRAVGDLNINYDRRRFHENTRLHLISRGCLLKWGIEHASTFWPENFSVHEKLIRFYNVNGKCPPQLDILSEGLDEILGISDEKTLSPTELRRRQISAALFVVFAGKNYVQENNFVAIAGTQAALFAAMVASEERHDLPISRINITARLAVRTNFLSALADLAAELGESVRKLDEARPRLDDRDYNVLFLEGHPLSDSFLWKARALKVVGLLSVLNIEQKRFRRDLGISQQASRSIDMLTKPGLTKFQIWGEAAIPQVLAFFWNWRISTAESTPNIGEYFILKQIVKSALSESPGYLASPYYHVDDAMRDLISRVIPIPEGRSKGQTQRHSSYFAESIFHCFVRANLKSHAKSIWPELTKLIHKSYLLDNSWNYCLWRCANGKNIDKKFPTRRNWADLQNEASDVSTPHVPKGLRDDPVMLLAFIIFFPHRALPEVIRYLHFRICRTWFLPFPRPTEAEEQVQPQDQG